MKKAGITIMVLILITLGMVITVNGNETKEVKMSPLKETAISPKELPTDNNKVVEGIPEQRKVTLEVIVNALEERKIQLNKQLQNEISQEKKQVLEIEIGYVNEQLSGWESELGMLN